MAWFFQPKDNLCVDCDKKIDVYGERHYIVWSKQHKSYKRECAACHDERTGAPRERRSVKDAVMVGRGKERA
jgi:hypothetical protein